jgi:hypothetical protein
LRKASTTSPTPVASAFAPSVKSQTTFLEEYTLRLPQSATFAEYAIRHIKRLVGDEMLVDMNEASVIKYQNDRLTEGAAPKTVNEEVGVIETREDHQRRPRWTTQNHHQRDGF